jgi:hypothetical protein
VRCLGIDVDYHQHIPQRHIFVFDRERGPFTGDFIEPVVFPISCFALKTNTARSTLPSCTPGVTLTLTASPFHPMKTWYVWLQNEMSS